MPRVFSLSKREADIAISLSRPTEGRLYARKLTTIAWPLRDAGLSGRASADRGAGRPQTRC